MSDGGNPLGALVSFWMFLKLLGVLASLMGGIYALFCLNRLASGVHRVADALETAAQNQANAPNAQLNAPSNIAAMQPFSPTASAPISAVPPAPREDISSTRSEASPNFTEHDVRPRSDSF